MNTVGNDDRLAVQLKSLMNVVDKSLFALPRLVRQQFVGEVGTYIPKFFLYQISSVIEIG